MDIPYHTRNFDNTAARIKKLVAVLDKNWFQNKKREFTKLCEVGNDFYVLDNTPDGYEEYYQSLAADEKSGTIPDFTDTVFFDKFCFYANYSISKVCGESVTNNIIQTIKEIVDDAGVDNDYFCLTALIADVKMWISQEVNDHIEYGKNEEYSTILRDFLRKIKWKIEFSFNNKLKALELILSYKKPTDTIKTKVVLTDTIFETKILNEIFYHHAINPFIEIEKMLIEDEWFTDNRWNDDKNILVSLILILHNRGYLKPIKGKSKNNYRLVYRRFFENRYGIIIKKQMQPSQILRFQLPKRYETTFSYIDRHSSGK
jgi:hypothetical protein